jgi:DNA (cytosine-5)-methyltransferase 1
VKNLKGHDSGKTWKTIQSALVEAGYSTYDTPIVLSPHQIGVPQHRERVFILGVRTDCLLGEALPPFPGITPVKNVSIESILLPDAEVPKGYELSKTDIEVLNLWEAFVQHFREKGVKIPTFPIWSDSWDSNEDTKNYPAWKKKFVTQNQDFYKAHKEFLSKWLFTARKNPAFVGARRKFEWQSGAFKPNDSLWNSLFQFRPSGIRVKRATYSPALVAMAQIVVVGSKKRKLCPREVARLQSFPDTFKLPASNSVAYKQFGNSVNVDVIRHMAKFLLSIPTVSS